MAKYVIDIPDEAKWIQYTQKTGHGIQNLKVESVYNLTPYTEPDEQSVKNNNIHLCWSCQNSSECHVKVKDVLFGDDAGNDNICCCNAYRPTESNASDEDEIRQKVEQEVWEFAGEFYNVDREVETLFGCDLDDICKKYTYSEAKAKYEEWRKKKDEIHEYDEIISEVPDKKAVIVHIDCWGQWHCVKSNGIFMVEINQQGYWRKTGRSFPELGDVLKKMREE